MKIKRRVTAQDVARELGISVMTVSRALNARPNVDDETRYNVVTTAKRLGYRPNMIAKSLVLRRTNTFGVVVPEIAHSFFPEAIRGIEEILHAANYPLILTYSAEDAGREARAIRMLESQRVDGLLISTAQTVEDHALYREAMRLGMPVVFFDRCVHGIGAGCVGINDEESARAITDHLVSHGLTRIAHLSASQKLSIGRARLRGFRKALREREIPCYDELIVESGLQEEGGYQAMKRVLSLPRDQYPTGVVAVNDPAAFGAMRAMEEAGLVIPDDIAIVGFSDDIRAALMPTPLTTVRQPAYEVGKCAAQLLLMIIEGKTTTVEDITIEAEIVIRRSCGCNGAGKRDA